MYHSLNVEKKNDKKCCEFLLKMGLSSSNLWRLFIPAEKDAERRIPVFSRDAQKRQKTLDPTNEKLLDCAGKLSSILEPFIKCCTVPKRRKWILSESDQKK